MKWPLALGAGLALALACSSDDDGTSVGGSGGSTSATGGQSAATGGNSSTTGGNTATTGGSGGSTSTGGSAGTPQGGAGGEGGSSEPGEFTLGGDFVMDGERYCHKDGQTRDTEGPYGTNQSPELMWSGVPAGTLSQVVTLRDRQGGVHWIMCNIPADVRSLPPNIDDADQPAGSEVTADWYGPGADNVRPYEYRVWALDVAELPGGCQTSNGGEKQGIYDSLPDYAISFAEIVVYGNRYNQCE
jgi:phosphatidylethanolamine-binding protein (PEBP) family uncharacterized protein